jgi:hypothetical protein
VSESLFQSVGLFNLFKIIYTILPVEDLASNHKASKPGLEPQAWASKIWSRARAHCKPSSGLGSAWAWTGSGFEARPSTSLPAAAITQKCSICQLRYFRWSHFLKKVATYHEGNQFASDIFCQGYRSVYSNSLLARIRRSHRSARDFRWSHFLKKLAVYHEGNRFILRPTFIRKIRPQSSRVMAKYLL